MKKRIMSLLLVLVMVFSILPIMPARRSAAEETETLFDRYIPVNQAYSAKVSPFSVTQGVSYSFSIGTRFKDETADDFRGLPDTFCNSHKALICVR